MKKAFAKFIFILVLLCTANPALTQGLIRDAELENSLRKIAAPLFKSAGLPIDSVDILLLNNSQMNAFVTNGQVIFVNYGLVVNLQTVQQLQAVLAHEIAHITAGHFTQRLAALANARSNAELGFLLGLASGIAGAPEASMGVILGTQSTAQRKFFTHTQDQESSADRSGLRILADAGIDPNAALEVLELFDSQDLFTARPRDPYTVTHPLTDARIRAIKQFIPQLKLAKPEPNNNEYWFTRMKAKLISFTDHPQAVLHKAPISDQSEIAHYMRAIAYHRLPDPDAAMRELQHLSTTYRDDPYYHELMGQVLLELGHADRAVTAYTQALKLAPDEPQIEAALGAALLNTGDYHGALPILQSAFDKDKRNPRLLRDLASAYAQNGQLGLAAWISAERYALLGDFKSARMQALRAQNLLQKGSFGWLQAADILLAIPAPKR